MAAAEDGLAVEGEADAATDAAADQASDAPLDVATPDAAPTGPFTVTIDPR